MHQLFVLLIVWLPIFVIGFVLHLMHWSRKRKSRLPFEIAATSRIPGFQLLQQYNDAKIDIFAYLACLQGVFLTPFVAYAVKSYFDRPVPIGIYLIIVPATFAFFTYKIWQSAKHASHLRLGLEAEWFVAHQLSEIASQGYRAFHDVQADGFNIDHLVVGPNGIFAIETKGRRKFGSNKKAKPLEDDSHRIKIRGSVIDFPNYQDKESIPQAIRQANWCSKWLSQAVGHPITVTPIVALPGWYVEYSKHKSDVPVLSGKALPSALPKLGNNLHSEQLISQVIYQIKQRIGRNNDDL